MENIQSKIAEIIEAEYICWSRTDNENITNMCYDAAKEIEKIVFAACQEQKKIISSEVCCKVDEKERPDEIESFHAGMVIGEVYDVIKSAPSPTSLERHWNSKEVLEMCEKAFIDGVEFWEGSPDLALEKFKYEVLEKVYGVKS